MNTPCSTCHTLYPQLNAFGRQFKLDAYALGAGTAKPIEAEGAGGRTALTLDGLPPLSVMLQAAYTSTSARLPDSQNNSAQLPQEASLFVAGRIAPGLGSFVQLTYSQEDGAIALDNTELRYAKQGMLGGKPVTFGAVLNNNPTLEDLWSSTPAWGFPWAAADVTPGPIAAALVDGALAQDVMGVGGYASFGGKFYVHSALYRSAHVGTTSPTAASENTIDNAALYWRFAWQHPVGQQYLELGTYGLHASLVPEGVAGASDDYDDVAVDLQYERPVAARNLIAHGSYIDERQDLRASAAAGVAQRQHSGLDTLKLDVGLYGERLAYVLGYASTQGQVDQLRYAPEELTGSAAGRPDSSAWLGELIYSPWQNVQLRLQYTAYTEFNGASRNYDGFGRDAADNNTLFLHAWLAW